MRCMIKARDALTTLCCLSGLLPQEGLVDAALTTDPPREVECLLMRRECREPGGMPADRGRLDPGRPMPPEAAAAPPPGPRESSESSSSAAPAYRPDRKGSPPPSPTCPPRPPPPVRDVAMDMVGEDGLEPATSVAIMPRFGRSRVLPGKAVVTLHLATDARRASADCGFRPSTAARLGWLGKDRRIGDDSGPPPNASLWSGGEDPAT